MPIDFDAELFGPVHDEFGVAGVITPLTSASTATVTMIEETIGVEIEGHGAAVSTVRPTARVRAAALAAASLANTDLDGASLLLNGRTYRVDSYEPRPTPNGEGQGEVRLFLIESA